MLNIILLIIVVLFLVLGIRIVRPTHKLVVETLGKYSKTCESGFIWIVPIIQSGYFVNMTEQMIDTKQQTVITKDNLNAIVDAVIYYKVNDVKAVLYNVDNHKAQVGSLTRTTLRNVIGNLSFSEANSKRNKINAQVQDVLSKETKSYGLEILRVELQKVEAPGDVQESMNSVVKSEREKIAATEIANAREIEADGIKRASIKKAQGEKESQILKAQGKAESIKLENEAASKYFVGEAQLLKKLEVTENSMRENSKIVVPNNSELVNVIGDLSGTPINIEKRNK